MFGDTYSEVLIRKVQFVAQNWVYINLIPSKDFTFPRLNTTYRIIATF